MFSKASTRETGFAGAVSPAWRDLAAARMQALRLAWSRHRTARILQGLDDAALRDIGVDRAMIDSVFHDRRYDPRR